MVRSRAKTRAAKAAALMLSLPVMAQAMAASTTLVERMPLPLPRPGWIDAAPVLDEQAKEPAPAPLHMASLPARMPLPVARPNWLDASEAQVAQDDEKTNVATKVATMPAHIPLPVPRPDFLDAIPDDETREVTRISKSTGDDSKRATPVSPLHAMIEAHARHHGVPLRLAHRIVQQESRYNPTLKAKAHFGLMQVSLPTAKSMGYTGDVAGLLDARTNLTYAMPYLANAWIVSGGHEEKARRLYMTGYYPEAKRKGVLKNLRKADSPPVSTAFEAADAR